MRKLELHHQILIALALGGLGGMAVHSMAGSGTLDPAAAASIAGGGKQLGTIFLRLLKMVVVPLIVCSLISGVSGMGDIGRLGKLGARTALYYLATSLLAISVGITVVNLVRPGDGLDMEALRGIVGEAADAELAVEEGRGLGDILWDQLLHMIPTNPVSAAADGDMLPLIFFSILFGALLARSQERGAERAVELVGVGFEVMMRMTQLVIKLAPIGVFGFMLHTFAVLGGDLVGVLAWYMATVALALLAHACITLPLLLRTLTGRSPLAFAGQLQKALLTAFSTASSNATLPLTMRCVEDEAGIDRRTSAFVLPLGATVNMDGTALYEAVAVLFFAQAFGHDLGLGQQIVVALTALLASIGAAGIPHAGLVMMVVVLEAVGLPTSAVGLILGVDRVLDMCRTTVNVWSDATATAVVDRYRETLGA